MSATILVVEDEEDLLDTLEFNLQSRGYATRRAATGGAALVAATLEPPPDLVLLDLMLPDMLGTEVCKRLRQLDATARVPIIMLTARTGEADRIAGFQVGADDYVAKPFSMHELLLRIQAVLRRTQQPSPATTAVQRFGALELDIESHRVCVSGEEIRLTALEFRLLTTLVERAGRVQSRDTLLNDVWEMQTGLTTRTVDTHVTRLRKKLGPEVGAYIETLRGFGYRFLDQRALASLTKSDDSSGDG